MKKTSIAKSTVLIILFSLIGKMMGFVRESMVAAIFGAGFEKTHSSPRSRQHRR